MSAKLLTSYDDKPNRTSIRCWNLKVDNEYDDPGGGSGDGSIITRGTYNSTKYVVQPTGGQAVEYEQGSITISANFFLFRNICYINVSNIEIHSLVTNGRLLLPLPPEFLALEGTQFYILNNNIGTIQLTREGVTNYYWCYPTLASAFGSRYINLRYYDENNQIQREFLEGDDIFSSDFRDSTPFNIIVSKQPL